MTQELSDEARMIRDTLADLRDRAADGAALWSGMAGLGMLGLAVDADAGGAGLGLADLCLVAQVLGQTPRPLPLLASEALCLPLLSPLAGYPGVAPVIAAAVAGTSHPALALESEVVAIPHAGGWRLDGAASLVLHGAEAAQLLIAARIADTPALFLVPADAPGLSRASYAATGLGPAADLHLRGVELPETALLLRGGPAAAALDAARARGSLVVAAEMVGGMERLLDLTTEYLRTRHQFGVPLSGFQALQHAAVGMFVELELARSMLDYGIAMMAAEGAEQDTALAAVKFRINAAARMVSETAVQLHGGIGMTMEHQTGRLFARLTALRFLFGDERGSLARLCDSGIGLLGE